MKARSIILFAAMCLVTIAGAQTVTNVVARQVGNTVEVTYDLDKPAEVSLLLSQDGGVNYAATPKSMTGDVGKGVTAGHKKIVWNLLNDRTDWDITRARFKVVAEDKSKKTFTFNGVSFTMIAVEGGTFTMGCISEQGSYCFDNEKPAHTVTLSDYYIGQTEVTQALWIAVMGTTVSQQRDKTDTSWPLRGDGDNYPMYYVSWEDCQTFVQKLNSLLSSQLGGKRFALPTEAQWEYAARGGKKSNGYKYSGSNTIGNVAWYTDNSGSNTHPVATKSPNELGLYDMTGNVFEWCKDWYGSYTSSSQSNPQGASSGSNRVNRGGSCSSIAGFSGVLCRLSNMPTYRYNDLGFRLVCL